MCDSPGFTKPTHGYGQEFGDSPAEQGELLDAVQERRPSREVNLLTDDERYEELLRADAAAVLDDDLGDERGCENPDQLA